MLILLLYKSATPVILVGAGPKIYADTSDAWLDNAIAKHPVVNIVTGVALTAIVEVFKYLPLVVEASTFKLLTYPPVTILPVARFSIVSKTTPKTKVFPSVVVVVKLSSALVLIITTSPASL